MGRERGQAAMVVVIAVTVVLSGLSAAVASFASAELPIAARSVWAKQALDAAWAGIADYEGHLAADPTYASSYCSSECSPSKLDPSNPAFVAQLSPDCAGGSWATLHQGASVAKYQYEVDSSSVFPSPYTSGLVTVYAAGKAGVGGRFACQQVEASFWVAAPTVANAVNEPAVTNDGWQNIEVPSSGSSLMSVVLAGGSGGPGGTGANIGGQGFEGQGGPGAELQAVFFVPAGDTLATVVGHAGSLGLHGGGSGFGNGGNGGEDSGGGGGASALCLEQQGGSSCTTSSPVCTQNEQSANPDPLPCVLAIAGGGGGGGEAVCWGSPGGNGGAGGLPSPGSTGGIGLTAFLGSSLYAQGGTGGTETGPGSGGAGYPFPIVDSDPTPSGLPGAGPNGAAGITFAGDTQEDGLWVGGSDSGGGGGGYYGGGSGGTGGDCGGGAGGGGGSSYVDAADAISQSWSYGAVGHDGVAIVEPLMPGSNVEVLESSFQKNQPACGSWTPVTVPPGVSEMSVKLWGAGGGGGAPGDAGEPGGAGGEVSFVAPVQPGEQVAVELGCGGQAGAWEYVTQDCWGCLSPYPCPQEPVASGGAGWSIGGQGGQVGCVQAFALLTWVTSVHGGGGGGGGGSSAICLEPAPGNGSSQCGPSTPECSSAQPSSACVLAIAGGGGGGGGGGCYQDTNSPYGGGGGGLPATGSFDDGIDGTGGDGSGGGQGGQNPWGGSGGQGGSAIGLSASGGTNGEGGPSGDGGVGGDGYSGDISVRYEPGGGGGGGGYSGGGGGGGNWCDVGSGVGGGGGGGSSWTAIKGATFTVPTTGTSSNETQNTKSCSQSTPGWGGAPHHRGCDGYVDIQWIVSYPAPPTGTCTAQNSSFVVPRSGRWTLQVAGGGGAPGLSVTKEPTAWQQGQVGLGGAGALLTLEVELAAGQVVEGVAGCAGFSDLGGAGFTNGGSSGTGGLGGGGGGSSAICLEPPPGNGSSQCGPSTPECSSTQTEVPCVLAIAGGGGGGGTTDGANCEASGLGGGAGGAVIGSDPIRGGNDSAGQFGGSSTSGDGQNGEDDGSSAPNDGAGGGGGGSPYPGGGAGSRGGGAEIGQDREPPACGGGGGSSWYSGLVQSVTTGLNTCGGAVPTDCPGFITASMLPGPTFSLVAERTR